jgi:hypothetical protein
MRLKKECVFLAACGFALAVTAIFLAGCEEDTTAPTRPKVDYKDQTFSLLVCDGNGNAQTGDPTTNWDHDGAAVCTLDWNGDGSGPNRVPVTYVYDEYPLIDGAAEQLKKGIPRGGDYWLWETTPWTVIKTQPMIGKGSGVKEVWVKALYTYVNPARIWFFFRWEDPSHTIQPYQPESEYGKEPAPVGGTMHYYWYQKGGYEVPSDGFGDNRIYTSREDWLALVWSTWFPWNKNNKGKDWRRTRDPEPVFPADPATNYNWVLVETVPGFQKKGIEACRGSGDVVYKAPIINNRTEPLDSPYGDKFYPGAVCDMWFFSASRTNYTAAGSWLDSDVAYMIDGYIGQGGFKYPPLGELTAENETLEIGYWLPVDSGIAGSVINGGTRGKPTWMAPSDPTYNPPGAYYIWSTTETAPPFSATAPWKKVGGARIAGYKHLPALGSVADIVCRCRWQQPNRMWYPPWEGVGGSRYKEKDNSYAKDWNYTLEMMREIGTISKIDPKEDVLLGLFDPHPGE